MVFVIVVVGGVVVFVVVVVTADAVTAVGPVVVELFPMNFIISLFHQRNLMLDI